MNILKLSNSITLKQVLGWILILTTFTPLVFIPLLMNQYSEGKFLFFGTLIFCASTLFLILVLKKQIHITFDFITKIATFLLITILVSILLNDRPLVGLIGTFERREGFLFYCNLYLYFIILKNTFAFDLEQEAFWKKFFLTTIIVSTIISIYGILQYFGIAKTSDLTSDFGLLKIRSTIGNSAILASYILISFFTTLWIFTNNIITKSFFTRSSMLLMSSLLIQFVCLILTGSRAGLIGLLSGIFALSLFYFFRTKSNTELKPHKIVLVLLTSCILLTGSLFAFGPKASHIITKESTFSYTTAKLTNFNLEDKTIAGRFELWKIALKGSIQKPILGWGPENYLQVYDKHYSERLSKVDRWHDRAHNNYLDILVAQGVIGFTLYIILITYLFKNIWRNRNFEKNEKTFITVIIISYLVHNLFLFQSITDMIPLVALAGYISTSQSNRPQTNTKLLQGKYIKIFFGIILIIFVLHITESASSYFTKKAYLENNSQLTLDLYQKAFRYELADSLILPYLIYSTTDILSKETISDQEKIPYLIYTYDKIINLDNQISQNPQLSHTVSKFFSLIGQSRLSKSFLLGVKSEEI